MDIYYKYAKFRSIEELLSATVKLSPLRTLNDPFECILNKEVEDNLLKNTSLPDVEIEIEEITSLDESLKENLILKRIYDGLNEYAIFSLSETPRNLLMWAHYADEHNGVCIGYKKNIFESIDNKVETDLGIESYTPIKVNYDNLRPQALSDQPSREKRKKSTLNQLITKSDDWMYEKEHRCIIPMIWADKIKIQEIENINANFSLTNILTTLIANKDIERNGNIYSGTIKGMSVLTRILGNSRNAIFLKDIDPESIVSIYFGCRFNRKVKQDIINTLSDPSHPLHHVKTLQYVLSSDRFEVIPARNKK